MTSIKEEVVTKPLTELVSLVRGVSYTKGMERREPAPGYIRLLRANNIQGDLVFNDVIYVPQTCVKPDQILRRGDIVVAMSSGSKSVVGKTAQHWHTGEPTTFGAFCGVLRPNASVDPAFLGWFLRTEQYRQFISEISAGVNINNLKREYFEQVEVPNPSLAQQAATAQIIDALVTATSSPRERLATIPALLKKFRQSVLAAACSGQLTADLRDSQIEVDIDEIGSIPETWKVQPFHSIIQELRNGVSPRPSMAPPGVPLLRISSTRAMSVDLDEVRYLPQGERFLPQFGLLDGDLLFTRYNGSLELLGVCGMVRGLNGRSLLYPDKLMRVRLKPEVADPRFIEIFFSGPGARERMTLSSRSTAGQQGVSGKDVKEQLVVLPPMSEQVEIVRRVESLFALADSIESRLTEATAQVGRTTQVILTKAFRGEL